MPKQLDRSQIRPGMKLTGGAIPVDDPRRARIRKGMFLTVDGGAVVTPGSDLNIAASIATLTAQLRTIRQGLDDDARKLRSRQWP